MNETWQMILFLFQWFKETSFNTLLPKSFFNWTLDQIWYSMYLAIFCNKILYPFGIFSWETKTCKCFMRLRKNSYYKHKQVAQVIPLPHRVSNGKTPDLCYSKKYSLYVIPKNYGFLSHFQKSVFFFHDYPNINYVSSYLSLQFTIAG